MFNEYFANVSNMTQECVSSTPIATPMIVLTEIYTSLAIALSIERRLELLTYYLIRI